MAITRSIPTMKGKLFDVGIWESCGPAGFLKDQKGHDTARNQKSEHRQIAAAISKSGVPGKAHRVVTAPKEQSKEWDSKTQYILAILHRCPRRRQSTSRPSSPQLNHVESRRESRIPAARMKRGRWAVVGISHRLPITPPRAKGVFPMKWPSRIAKSPRPRPSGAQKAAGPISARETAAPAHRRKKSHLRKYRISGAIGTIPSTKTPSFPFHPLRKGKNRLLCRRAAIKTPAAGRQRVRREAYEQIGCNCEGPAQSLFELDPPKAGD